MRELLLMLMTVAVVIFQSQVARSEQPDKAGPPSPERLFKELFAKLDKDKDGKLTLEEFTEGMERLHKEMAKERGPGPGMPPPFGRPGMMRDGGPGHWDHCPMGGPRFDGERRPPCMTEDRERPTEPGPGVHGPVDEKAPPASVEERLKELEAKVRKLEAK
jgi:hypothetical protein